MLTLVDLIDENLSLEGKIVDLLEAEMSARRELLQEKSQRQKIEAYVDTLQEYIRHLKRRNEILSNGLERIFSLSSFKLVFYVFTREKVAQQTYERSTILNDLRELNLEMTSVRKEKEDLKKKREKSKATRTDQDCPVCQTQYGGENVLVCFKTCGHCLCFTW
ncbi:Oidioi.mRNA.OKI2018_I69.PAR.g11614.t1.cds [Oikopleura dioica]|uniref:Oidioi.mRNA.OKI2018_I69.PAR.g11614.t1.cds n=1 Tax=Oikopleura dioica TaxID=34765 RepID=A0ABN7RZI8_OIKDI|nr:Oidioi.mRNA.OKI2018_I69.PAR.g11614.t1.cds [Oikopleura dioica]